MSDLDDLRDRVTRLEERVNQESALNVSIDSDLSDVATSQRAANHLIQALSITQSQHTEALARLEVGMHRITEMLTVLIEREQP